VQGLFRWLVRAHPFPYGKQVAAWAMALLWSIGGATTLLVVLLPHPPELRTDVVLVIGAVAPIVALIIVLLRDRIPMWIYPGVLATGTSVVSVLVYAGGGGTASVSLSYFYTWVAVYALLFFRPIVALLQVVLAATAYGIVLVRLGSFAGGNFTALEPTILAAVVGTTGGVILLLSHARAASELDPLTTVANRRGLDRALDGELHGDEDTPMILAVIDIDHFKQINDREGHQAGDRDPRAPAPRRSRGGDLLVRVRQSAGGRQRLPADDPSGHGALRGEAPRPRPPRVGCLNHLDICEVAGADHSIQGPTLITASRDRHRPPTRPRSGSRSPRAGRASAGSPPPGRGSGARGAGAGPALRPR